MCVYHVTRGGRIRTDTHTYYCHRPRVVICGYISIYACIYVRVLGIMESATTVKAKAERMIVTVCPVCGKVVVQCESAHDPVKSLLDAFFDAYIEK